ncbi:MAG: hypothetical protein WAS23_02070, partial [Dokdonella sp.]|uniref:hypothetical protein n=1 Tax=Dokdonella sp. TaxID=2291710 RepID=UPI003BB03084
MSHMSIPASVLAHPVFRNLQCPQRGGMRGLLDAATALASASRDAVCAILVSSTGSAHRERGAMALLDEGGLRAGS